MSESVTTSAPASAPATSTPSSSEAVLAQNMAKIEATSKSAPEKATEAAPVQEASSKEETPAEKPKVNVEELVRGSHKKFEEAARLRREAEAAKMEAQTILQRLESDPSFLDERPDLAAKLEDYYVNKLAKEWELQQLDPKEQELRRLQEEKQLRDKQAKQQEESYRLELANQQAVKYAERLESEMVAALQGSGLPRTPRTIKLMAEKMSEALDIGYEPTYEEVIEEVRAAYHADRGTIVKEWDAAPDSELLEHIGLERARRISRAYVGHLKGQKVAQVQGQPARPAPIEALKQKQNLQIQDVAGLTDAERFKLLHGK